MIHSFSERDKHNRSTLTINGRKVGRVHFREYDAWLNPYKTIKLKNKSDLERLGLTVEANLDNKSYPVKVYLKCNNEDEVAKAFERAFYDL